MLYKEIIFLIIQVQCVVRGLSEETVKCDVEGIYGTCIPIKNCSSALKEIHFKKYPKICDFIGKEPVVCCIEGVNTNNTHPELSAPQRCDPLPEEWTPKKTGQKALDKCIEYQEALYPCEKNGSSWIRNDYCYKYPTTYLLGGNGWDAERDELTHMALLGYGNDSKTAEWLCAGSLISDWFILTAAHCAARYDKGNVTFAVFGILKRSDPEEYWDIYKIDKIIKHPEYASPIKYNDIALLKTERQVKIGPNRVPICLDVGIPYGYEAKAAGWGALGHHAATADVLQIIPLFETPQEECSSKFKKHRFFKDGINFTSQMCYGDKVILRDTCQGDSGGPLQVLHPRVRCMDTAVGVTSFGFNCGTVGSVGVYTRVKHYVAWIEGVVWP